jgi:hypothetical protein
MKKWLTILSFGILSAMLLYGLAHYGEIYNFAYRLKNGSERVIYHGRTYYNPAEKTLNELPVRGDALVPTGETVIGLPVMDTPYSLQLQKERNVVPTVLILELADDKYLVYSLSGGP